jgi:hypothetical protein
MNVWGLVVWKRSVPFNINFALPLTEVMPWREVPIVGLAALETGDGLKVFYKEYFADFKQMHNFASQEPAKPLYNAQMCGSFFIYTLWF